MCVCAPALTCLHVCVKVVGRKEVHPFRLPVTEHDLSSPTWHIFSFLKLFPHFLFMAYIHLFGFMRIQWTKPPRYPQIIFILFPLFVEMGLHENYPTSDVKVIQVFQVRIKQLFTREICCRVRGPIQQNIRME